MRIAIIFWASITSDRVLIMTDAKAKRPVFSFHDMLQVLRVIFEVILNVEGAQ